MVAKRRSKRSSSRMSSSSMTCPPQECGPGCVGWGLLGAVLGALGLYLLVGGVMKQWTAMPWTNVGLWYLGGLLVMCCAKKCKWKACGKCR